MQHKKSAMSAWPLQRSARAWNPRSWQHPRKVEARHGQRAVRRSGAPPSLHTQERSRVAKGSAHLADHANRKTKARTVWDRFGGTLYRGWVVF